MDEEVGDNEDDEDDHDSNDEPEVFEVSFS